MTDFQRGIWHQAPHGTPPEDFFRIFFTHWHAHPRPLIVTVKHREGTLWSGNLNRVLPTYIEIEQPDGDWSVSYEDMTAAIIAPELPIDTSSGMGSTG